MFYSVDGRIIQIDGRFPIFQDNTLTFVVSGPEFPYSFSNLNRIFRLRSNTPNSAEVNWGDGSIINYQFTNEGEEGYRLDFQYTSSNGADYIYQDSNTGDRVITFKIKNPLGIYLIQTGRTNIGENFPSNIGRFINLKSLIISQFTGVKNFPNSFANLQKLTEFEIFDGSLDKLSDSLLELSLITLRVRNSIDLSQPFSVTNFDKLNQLQNTLETLDIGRCNVNEYPSNFSELNITNLNVDSQLVPVLPPEIYNLPKLTFFSAEGSFNSGFQSFQNFDLLPVSLEVISIYTRFNGGNIGTEIFDFSNQINLKAFYLFGSVMDVEGNVDEFISRIYNLINQNASKSTGDTKFRQMTIRCTGQSGTFPPTGTYQQPAGFVLGSDNGIPASPKEKIWVMVNQYEHTWNYTE